MAIWIVTIGGSDVQLKPKSQRQRSWEDMFRQYRSQLEGRLQFKPYPPDGDERRPALVKPRVMGTVYGNADVVNSQDLVFPLLDNFHHHLSDQADNDDPINRVVILLTDQSGLYGTADYVRNLAHPYWQDTCTLQPILESYFSQYLPNAQQEYLTLKPESPPGLDDWDTVLEQVQQVLFQIESDEKTVYVSHQAGTPAISSAIQFTSLTKFGDRTQFLVSSELDINLTRIITGSRYLSGIRFEEAKALLKRYDYAGVLDLLQPHLHADDAFSSYIRSLLTTAISWNLGEFQTFHDELLQLQLNPYFDFGQVLEEKIKVCEAWWWFGYEAAYLAVIRLEQRNTVEALFHSFRAMEGSMIKWARDKFHPDHLDEVESNFAEDYAAAEDENNSSEITKVYSWTVKPSILHQDVLPDYLKSNYQLKKRLQDEKLGLYSASLYELLKTARPDWEHDRDIYVVWDIAANVRNLAFHQLLGLYQEQVFAAWDTASQRDWENRLCNCLNFLSEQRFSNLREASLMPIVHAAIEQAIDDYQIAASRRNS
ncbi:hypothetical protein IQ266_25150 [filamentous cyanobacterium LEGE 11480]|uniref:Uncharacterized protein n=1 Tax=Romeriopsis navalis LEGE 11480 TaxID=2777977 RepID=A0A928VQR1_9CYAN|nr:hypothetical protein [Romeriopsis navalis]MBE9033028.1 hypothetical protein [Romeriopsis navalis LEGE 11480]